MVTAIVRHRLENKKRNTMQPLIGKEGFDFYTYPGREGHELPKFEGYLRLAVDGELLTKKDKDRPLLLLDATWRKVGPMNKLFDYVEPRSLPALKSAYPYIGKYHPKPIGALSSVEALATAFFIFGRADWVDVLENYYWKKQFLELNKEFFGL